MAASSDKQVPAISISDLPMGPGAGQVPRADEVHPRSWFQSGERTGTAGVENIAHGLGRVPNLVIITITELPAGLAAGADILEGTHDATNVVVTVSPNTVKYKVKAV